VLRKIVDDRGLRQKVLAAKIGITEASLSNILNGKARPRQLTLPRLIDQLQVKPEELQRILAAYDHAERIKLPERPASPEQPIPQDVPSSMERQPSIPIDEIERVKRYMEVKSMSVTFLDDVEKELGRTGLNFERAYRQDNIICDFLLSGPPRIALDCKYNLNRDWDRTVASVRLLKEHLDLELVLIVVPYENDTTLAEADRITEQGGKIISVADLEQAIRLILPSEGGAQ
jgi:transcriptional regulator with XRE-family HTH domain